MKQTETLAHQTCRVCPAGCPVQVTLKNGKVHKVEGDRDAPLYEGFICPKGRALAGAHNENRLTQHLKRQKDGTFATISTEQLIEEIGSKLTSLIDKHGPETVALFAGGPVGEQAATNGVMTAFLEAIGSPSFFSDLTIDQPGLMIAPALHGTWSGGYNPVETADVVVFVGCNPIISKYHLSANPGATIKRLKKRGAKLIVIDPRRTETARHADLFLQCIPGEDPAVMAGLIHLLFKRGAVNQTFTDLNVEGLESLKQAVEPFSPDYVAERAGISKEDLQAVASVLAQSQQGKICTGVGPSMATRGTLTAYLSMCIQSLRGFWAREGAKSWRHSVLSPPRDQKAQPVAPIPAWGFGKQYRIRGLQQTTAGMPAGALPGEILTEGEGQIRALFMHAGSLTTWPDSGLAKKALESLDLLIVHETAADLTPTSMIADYVIATHEQFEYPHISLVTETGYMATPGNGFEEPYAAYQPAVVEPPSEALLEPWQTYYRVSQQMGITLEINDSFSFFGDASTNSMDMSREPSTDELYEMLCRKATVPLSEIKKHPSGNIFENATAYVQPRDPDCDARLQLADVTMLAELNEVATESYQQRRGTNETFNYLYIPRRMQKLQNSKRRHGRLTKPLHNPAFLHSDDLEALHLVPGDSVRITSRHGEIIGFVDIDNNLRRGVLSMSHGFGGVPGNDEDPAKVGSNVNELLSWEDDFDPYVGMPRMGAVPVAITPIDAVTPH